ncbi:MAG: adenosylmethionine decarboxylase [Candidatus Diapherotrites archaeon]|nr:adenosylmethionine decarboxylase [Candidatus Diapherotrites archaeon]
MTMGMHIIMELYGCPSELIAHVSNVKRIFDELIEEAEINRISEAYHQFRPYGVTGIVLLEESHISVHTWPEYGYVAMDIYTCGSNKKAIKAAKIAEKLFMPEKILKKELIRGLEHETSLTRCLP